MPYLTAVATVDAGDTHTVYIMMAPSWQAPIASIPPYYIVGEDGFDTGVSNQQGDADVDAELTAWMEANGWEVRRGWAHTQFGIQAHVRYKPGNDYRLPTPRSFNLKRAATEGTSGS